MNNIQWLLILMANVMQWLMARWNVIEIYNNDRY